MKIAERLEKDFWENIRKNPNLLKSLLTNTERNGVIRRWAAIKLIKKGVGSRQISRDLDISRQTVSAIKRSLKENSYKSYWERGKTERKKKVFSPLPKKPLSKDFIKYLEGKRAVKTKYGTIYTRF